MRALLIEILEWLKKNKRSHDYCEDSWYSCPKHPDGCSNDGKGEDCDCGADKHNAEIDSLCERIKITVKLK